MHVPTASEIRESATLDYATPPEASGGAYKWVVVGMLWFVCLFNYADRQAIYSVYPVLRSELNLSMVQLAVLGSAFMWVYALAGPPAGRIADRVSRRMLILGGLIFWSVITLATGWSTRYGQLVLFRGLEGLGEAFYFPASMSLIADYHSSATRSRAMSLHQTSVYAGTIAGGVVAGYLAQHYSWRTGFYVFGWAGIVLGIVLLAVLKEPVRGQADLVSPDAEADDGGTIAALVGFFTNPMAIILTLAFIGANSVANVFLAWMPTFLGRKFGLGLGSAGLNATVWFQVGSVLGVLAGGVMADFAAKRFPQGRAIVQATGLLLGFPLIFLAGLTGSLGILLGTMAFVGFFKGMYDANIWAALFDAVPIRRRAFSLGLMNALGWLGASVAPIAVAAGSARWGMDRCISAGSVVYLVAGILLIVGARAFPKREAIAVRQGFPVGEVEG